MKIPSNLKTGDIVLFSGSCFISNIIKIFTLCKWSHVGMIIIDDRYDEPLLYESTGNNSIPCLDLGFNNKGVQVVKLSQRVNSYQGSVSIRRLRMTERSDTVRYKLRLLRMALVGRPFERVLTQVLGALFKSKWVKEDLRYLLCSEKTAQAYIECGWLSGKTKAHHYTPSDFAGNIKLENGYLTKLQVIKNGSK